MLAIYVHDPRPEAFDRARALADALGPDAHLVSAHPPRHDWPGEWTLLPGSDLGTWIDWLAGRRPECVIVDGPAAHARAVVSAGAAMAIVAVPGGGVDGDRGAAYADATAILAPWSAEVGAHWPERWRERTIHLGAIGHQAAEAGRLCDSLRSPTRSPGARWRAVALWPTGAGPHPRERREIAVETPGWQWTYAPDRDLLERGPVWSALVRADVAVCMPSPTTLAALTAMRVPAVLVLPERPAPAEEFLATAAARTAAALVRHWPRPDEWRQLLTEARTLDGSLWSSWSPEAGLAGLRQFAAGRGSVAGVVPA